MTPKELRGKSLSDLSALEKELREELFKLKLQNGLGSLEKNHRLGELRRDIARILTLRAEKRSLAESQAA
ncbi:MAG: 50S ribosomal protein L29 [Deltaproteobacteria bacterium]|nr:50S ribosomal protein L29 [Deltaproteobacteria bacterium]